MKKPLIRSRTRCCAPKPNRQARQARGGRNGRDVEAELRQCRKDRANDDEGGARAVQQSRQGFHVLLAHPRDPAQALGPGRRNQAARQRTQDPVQDQGDHQDRGDANSVRRPQNLSI